jgi:hypothetical protein
LQLPILQRNENRSTSWKCIHCPYILTGSNDRQEAHLSGIKIKGAKISQCTSTLAALIQVRKFIIDREALEKKRKREEAVELSTSKKAAFVNTIPQMIAISQVQQLQNGILKYVVNIQGAASLVDDPSFLNMLELAADLGPTQVKKAIIGHRHQYGLNNPAGHDSDDPPVLGDVLQRNLEDAQRKKLKAMVGVDVIGGTLCSDGAKNRRRNALNTVLLSIKGVYFVQTSDACGEYKTAQYLFDDIMIAIRKVGIENVFIVCLDGACKKNLRMINLSDVITKIFGQRCSTHGCDLLLTDISKYFSVELRWITRLLHFICRHDVVYY